MLTYSILEDSYIGDIHCQLIERSDEINKDYNIGVVTSSEKHLCWNFIFEWSTKEYINNRFDNLIKSMC